MIPIVTPSEMAEIDRAATVPVEVLIDRAGAAVARSAIELMGGTYGRRVAVLAGPGNNGADGRVAAERLRRRGVRTTVYGLDEAPEVIEGVDLFVDAALGTGSRPGFAAPRIASGLKVLAVDLPSGLDASTGEAGPGVIHAHRTVTFQALKPGLLLEPGRSLAGDVEVADIGLDASSARAWLVEDSDVEATYPRRRRSDHKWSHAVWVIAGSPGMSGAASLAARAALRAGAGYVRLSSPGLGAGSAVGTDSEAVGFELPEHGWAGAVLAGSGRFGALVVGPGLGSRSELVEDLRALLDAAEIPVVLDGDALSALGTRHRDAIRTCRAPVVLTPHDGEYERLGGVRPVADRFEAARSLAANTEAVVLLKGPVTLVARPDGTVFAVGTGTETLATAGSGDVLSGMVGAVLALGAEPALGAALAAHLHGLAGTVGSGCGLVAGDLAENLPTVLDRFF